jgi:hypothetical protein
MASFSCLAGSQLPIWVRRTWRDASCLVLRQSRTVCSLGGSLMILHLLRWLCRTSCPVASRNCAVVVFSTSFCLVPARSFSTSEIYKIRKSHNFNCSALIVKTNPACAQVLISNNQIRLTGSEDNTSAPADLRACSAIVKGDDIFCSTR